MAIGIDDKGAYDTTTSQGRITPDPNDVSAARPVYDEATGQWQWIMPNGTPLGGSTTNTGDNGMGGTGFVGTLPNIPDRGSFAPYGGGDTSGGGNGSALPLAKLAKAAIPLATATAGRAMSGGSGVGTSGAQLPPELSQLLALAMRRMLDQEGLFQSINAQAKAGLPTIYQKG